MTDPALVRKKLAQIELDDLIQFAEAIRAGMDRAR
jgi:hypothetical protein